MVMTLADHDAVTPAGKPVAAPIPVAPVVLIVIGARAMFGQSVVLEEGGPAVLIGFTVTVDTTGLPIHPFKLGVMVYTTFPAAAPVAVSVCAMLLPLPFDAPVTAVDTCVQVNVAPAGTLVSGRLEAVPEQMVEVAATDATGGSLRTN